MAAKINNFPQYVVYDRTYEGLEITYSGSGDGVEITGTTANCTDLDLNTSYNVNYYNDKLTASTNLLIDFKKIYWNVVCSMKFSTSTTYQTGGSGSQGIQTSTDGVNWTSIDTLARNTSYIKGYNLIAARYILISARAYHSSYTTQASVNLSEIKLMGSG